MTKTGLAIVLIVAVFALFAGVGLGIMMERESHRQAFHAEQSR